MTLNYMISEIVQSKGICMLGSITNVPDWAEMHYGEPQSAKFPEDAAFEMSDAHPKNIKTADAMGNTDRLLVVSEAFRDLLVELDALKNNELLPVRIVNHKKRTEKGSFFVVHQIHNPKCVDEALTVGQKGKVNKEAYLVMEKLVLDESKIDPEVAIFRPAEYTAKVFFRKDVAAKIEAAKLVGIRFYELDGYEDFL